MAFIENLKKCAGSRPAKTLYWLVFAIACCVGIVLFLASLDISQNEKFFVISESLDFSPRPNHESVIYLRYKDPDSYHKWTKKITKFMKPYKEPHPNQVDCSFNRPPLANQTCAVRPESFMPCIEGLHFGYSKASPCIFIKFRKNLNFTPEYLDMKSLEKLSFGDSFTKHVNQSLASPHSVKTIWVSCEGRSAFNKEILGTVNYMPWTGFPNFAFQNRENEGYSEPLVAIQFTNPRVGIVIEIDCKVVARNFNETISFKLLINEDDD